MSDKDRIATLISIASDGSRLQAAQHVAAQRLLAYDHEIYPSDGCAITLSVLLQEAGIDIPDTFGALDLARALKKDRGWQVIDNGSQQPGDVGTTCGKVPDHGSDHIYLTLKLVNSDEMVIADNQQPAPHFRWVSGKGGKTPTKYFLRAV